MKNEPPTLEELITSFSEPQGIIRPHRSVEEILLSDEFIDKLARRLAGLTPKNKPRMVNIMDRSVFIGPNGREYVPDVEFMEQSCMTIVNDDPVAVLSNKDGTPFSDESWARIEVDTRADKYLTPGREKYTDKQAAVIMADLAREFPTLLSNDVWRAVKWYNTNGPLRPQEEDNGETTDTDHS